MNGHRSVQNLSSAIIESPRVRFAPSPTGYLHIGGARTALFNYLFARHNGGVFVLRIEDTDTERSRKEFEDDIIAGLRWLGIEWDEGPDCGGPYGPYRQSVRSSMYERYLRQLEEQGRIYPCYCTKEELEKEKQEQILAKQPPRYSGKCRTLTHGQRSARDAAQMPSMLRFELEPSHIIIDDLVRNSVQFDTALMDDFIIARNYKTPLYNFAVVIDDALMNITHVIRGEEHISNTPKQIQLAQALGLAVPRFGHLPIILNPDRTKLSKRENKTSLIEYKTAGYLSHALVNFMALLGWNPGGDRERFSHDELIELFEVKQVNKSGSIFDTVKLDWFNAQAIRELDINELVRLCVPYFISAGFISSAENGGFIDSSGISVDTERLKRIIISERERIKKLSDIVRNTSYFFTEDLSYDAAMLKWKDMDDDDIRSSLTFSSDLMSNIDELAPSADIERIFREHIAQSGRSNGAVLWPLRVALCGLTASQSPFEIASIIGIERSRLRIRHALEKLT